VHPLLNLLTVPPRPTHRFTQESETARLPGPFLLS
jgi:hypothetical protein